MADEVFHIDCQFGGRNQSDDAQASRQCNDYGVWESAVFDECRTFVEYTLQTVEKVSLSSTP